MWSLRSCRLSGQAALFTDVVFGVDDAKLEAVTDALRQDCNRVGKVTVMMALPDFRQPFKKWTFVLNSYF